MRAPCSVLVVRTGSHAREASAGEPPPVRYRSVLIATDGSPTAAHAAHLGAALGRALGATVTLAHVGDELMGRIVLKDTAERLGEPDLPQKIASGDPGKTIARLADEDGSDLVVVGNKGIAGARRVLGSVPNTVSHNAECDVLIVHTVGRSRSRRSGRAPGHWPRSERGGSGCRRLLRLERAGQLAPGGDPELAVRTGEVGLDGSRRNEQGLGDLVVGTALCGELSDAELARG
jgi:nucleotide-binding universal stress UspA family protein